MSTTNSINSFSSTMRLTGLSGSGIDTEALVKQLMDAERIPLDRLYQKRQLAEWRCDAYREIINKLRELKDAYFDIAKSGSNLTSASGFIKYSGTSGNEYVTISGNAESTAGSHTVSIISLATAQTASSAGGVTKPLKGNAVSDFNLSGKKIRITLDGVTREITLDNYSETGSDIVSNDRETGLQDLIDKAFGAGKIKVGYDESAKKLSLDTVEDSGATRIILNSGSSENGLMALGFKSAASNRLNTGMTLDSLSNSFANELTFNEEGKLELTINSKEFSFDKYTSLSGMMNTINSDPDANASIKYDEIGDKFIITAKQRGSGDNIAIEETGGNFFGAGGAGAARIDTNSETMTQGADAKAKIDGQVVVRNSNTFIINGTTYTLLKAHADPAAESETVSLSVDTEAIFNNIKGFIDKYNETIDLINTKLSEKYDRDFQPLTDAQKEEMSEDEIKKWEEKAKTGLLRNDSMLQDIVYGMRRALTDDIEGVDIKLSDIGITTGDYSEQGKLIIPDEAKLKAAIEKNPYAISDLFAQKADIDYSDADTTSLRAERYNNEGLANRLSDILNDIIRTTDGKGKLLEKAGVSGDSTEFTNMLYKQIEDYNDDIDDMVARLTDKENAYYAKFTVMEQYISQMTAQSNWLYSQFSSSSSN